MTEENNPGSEAVGLPPASQKTKEQWLEEGKVLMFYAPIRYEEALAAFEQATFLHRDEEALASYAHVIRLDGDPFYAWMAHLNSGTLLASRCRYEEALAAYEEAIRLEPKQAFVYVYRGTMLSSLARDEEALAAYEEASRLEPNNASIWRHIGDVLISLERPDEAKQAYARAGQPGSREEA